jgi:membrane protease YdiL (CAAX protease family)
MPSTSNGAATLPPVSRTSPLLPVSPMERLFFLVPSISAGVCEETCYRGLPLRGLAGSMRGAILMLPLTAASFVFVHGWFGLEHLGAYASAGLAFGVVFIALGRRRLEWLMAAHAILDAACVAAP